MRILHINTADNEGGAARAAYRLHTGLKNLGHQSRMLVRTQISNDPDVSITRRFVGRHVDSMISSILERFGMQDVYYPCSRRILSHDWVRSADIIQLHNLHGFFFAFPDIARLSRKKPVFWLLHDMWALTGHCVYSYDCQRWQIGCGSCPLLREDYLPLRYDTTAWHWRLKEQVYTQSSRLEIITPSKWLYSLVSKSPILKHLPVHHIPYGLDTDRFRPIDKSAARAVLRIDPKARVLLFSAHILGQNMRKGGAWFEEALSQLRQQGIKDISIITAGDNGSQQQTLVDFPCKYLGYINHDYLLAAVLSAADLFVTPSLADNLPLSIMESMACGTPVVAFDIGGVSDIVRHMETGYLARYKDAADLANGIRLLLDDADLRQKLGHTCRGIMEREYSLELQTRRHLKIYEKP